MWSENSLSLITHLARRNGQYNTSAFGRLKIEMGYRSWESEKSLNWRGNPALKRPTKRRAWKLAKWLSALTSTRSCKKLAWYHSSVRQSTRLAEQFRNRLLFTREREDLRHTIIPTITPWGLMSTFKATPDLADLLISISPHLIRLVDSTFSRKLMRTWVMRLGNRKHRETKSWNESLS